MATKGKQQKASGKAKWSDARKRQHDRNRPAQEDRKKTRRAQNAARHSANDELRALGVLTPWQAARKARAERRAKTVRSGT